MLLRAFAKINLTLDVFSKRPDGFHGIASVMQTVSLYDSLRMEVTSEPGIGFTCDAADAPDVPTDSSNLVVRAVQTALEAAPHRPRQGIAMHLEKRIPSQAGLGGGSSDAAAALRGVNALLSLGLDEATLGRLAASLGSDVPFFLVGGAAAARGRGEKVTPLPDAPPYWVVIVKPDQNVSTGWAYGALDAIPERPSHRGTKRMEEALNENDRGRFVAFQSNDFELPVFEQMPALAWLHDELRMAGAHIAHLCGSGSALYGLAETEPEAGIIAARMRLRYSRVFTAQLLTRAQSTHIEDAH